MSRRKQAPTVYKTQPLVAPGISGYLPEEARGFRDPFAPVVERETRVAVPTREVVCYECGKKSLVPRAALSAHCVHCCAHLTMTDYTLKPGARRLNIRTLGEVTLPSHVELSLLTVVASRMKASGKVNGIKLRVTDTLTLDEKAELDGQVRAAKLLVRKGARARVSPGLSVESAEVQGTLQARVHAAKYVHVCDGGALIGDCHTPELRLEPGAVHRGTWYQIPS